MCEVYAPRVEESVNVSSATNIYQVRLTDALVSSLALKRVRIAVAFIAKPYVAPYTYT